MAATSQLAGALLCSASPAYSTSYTFEELSRQLAISQQQRRLSRSSHSYTQAGSAHRLPMRVSKPGSANNSPRAVVPSRWRPVMTDISRAAIPQYQAVPAISPHLAYDYAIPVEPIKRAPRPVSWHPGTHFQQLEQLQWQQYATPQGSFPTPPVYPEVDFAAGLGRFPPTPLVYSGQTSPESAFSPLTLPYAVTPSTYLPVPELSLAAPAPVAGYIQASPEGSFAAAAGAFESPSEYFSPLPSEGTTMTTASFRSRLTAPPTPEYSYTGLPAAKSADDPRDVAIPADEEEGEILVGIGLYDKPDDTDDQMPGHYDGSFYGISQVPRPAMGKGLKLEEGWAPPAEQDDEGSDEDEDAESDD